MGGVDPHTVKAFDEDLEQIRALVCEMGGLAETAINNAVEALVNHDEAGAARIVATDFRIDELAEEVERQCVRLIALRAPMADDLREVLSAFKIAILVERMGDCARSIAEQVRLVPSYEYRNALRRLQSMCSAVGEMVRSSLDAFVTQDSASAESVSEGQDAVQALGEQLFRDLLDMMSESPSKISPSTCLLLASQKLERIGDHAGNIARVVFFAATGERLSERGRRLTPANLGAI